MSTYQVDMPDGSSYRVEMPEDQPVAQASIGAPQGLSVKDVFPQTTQNIQNVSQHPITSNYAFPLGNAGRFAAGAVSDIGNAVNSVPASILSQLQRVSGGRPMQSPLQALQTALHGGEQTLGENQQPSRLDPLVSNALTQAALYPAFEALGAVRGARNIGQTAAGVIENARIPKAPNIPDFLRGNPKAIQGIKAEMQATENAMAQTAHETVKQFRQRGTFHEQISQFLRDKSQEAWAPMKAVTASIPEQITTQEIKSAASSNPMLANNPERLQAVHLFLDDVLKEGVLPKTGRPFTGTASDWSDLSSEVGMTMRRVGLKGTSARTFSEVVSTDLRTAIGDVLQAKAPPQLQGAVANAKFQWGNYASDRDTIFKYLQPGAAPNVSTNPGTAFLVKAAKGELTPFEQEFFDRMQQESGINLMTPLQQHMKAMADQGRKLMKAQNRGATGKTIARYLPWATTALGVEEGIRRHR